MHFYQKSTSETLNLLNSSRNGLSKQQAATRKKKYGPNVVKVNSTPLWKKLLEPFLDVFALVLVGAVVISLWQNEIFDAAIISSILIISALIYYVQRFSTERVLKSLNRQLTETVSTIRNRQLIKISAANLVPGDIVELHEGQKIPADLRIIKASNLRVDESILTGESLPIQKTTATLSGEKQVYEQTNMIFSGSFVVGGIATGVVVATGNNTQFGNIATLSVRGEPKSPVQQKINQLITKIVIIVAALSVIAFAIAVLRGMDLVESLRFVIALAVSAIPEGLPIAISVILVLGMRRMAGKKALVNQMRAIETLGAINTIATDKTGTLTENKLAVHEIWSHKSDDKLKKIIARVYNQSSDLSDPLDKSLMEFSRKNGLIVEGSSPSSELPFDQKFTMSATVWHSGDKYDVFIKGSPEAILKYSSASSATAKSIKEKLKNFTTKGYRVVALASVNMNKAPKTFSEIVESKITFEGLTAIADTLRPEAASAIKSALQAGVSVRMITGDHAETAFHIGKNLGIVKDRSEVLDCRELDALSDQELAKIVNKTKVFARVIPEQKYRLLTILKKHNITAMTGDGVNDVPALTNAHIGVAMGSGSHIAKDAGDIVLLDDNFKTIIDAMHEGRVIIANIRRMLFYLLATNAGEMLAMMGALIIGTRLPLEPVQILWVNLITDTTLAIPLGLEPGEKNVMKRKPLKPNAPILGRTMIIRTILAAITIAALTLVTYIFFAGSHGHTYAQTLAFTALVVSQWGNAFSARSSEDSLLSRLKVMNRSFYVGLAIAIILQALVLFGPLGQFMHVAQVGWQHLAVVSLISFIMPIATCEIHKAISKKR